MSNNNDIKELFEKFNVDIEAYSQAFNIPIEEASRDILKEFIKKLEEDQNKLKL